MAIPNASDAAQKWASNLSGSTDRIAKGAAAVTTSPGQAAARQKSAYQQGVAANVDKWAARVAAVPLGEWQQAMINKGAPRVASGATAAQPKMEAFLSKFLPHVQGVVNGLPPRGNIDQNINRMVQAVKGFSTFRR